MIWILAGACAIAAVPAGLRWLRVAQREHYLPGEVTRFARRWWYETGLLNRVIYMLAFAGVIVSITAGPLPGLLVAAAQVGPVGLSVRGKTSSLAWTPRLIRLASGTGSILVVCFVAGGLLGYPLLIVTPLFLLYWIVDLVLRALAPYERRAGQPWVDKAAAKLRDVAPDVVAITGSYGKTTAKRYVAHLLSGSRRVVASPASFNNRMGLARAINENLTPGTEIFVAEMGTYGPGEIAELCSWIQPKVAALVSVGPVHLERFKTLENIVTAKAEILDRAEVGVICVDHPLLADLARERARSMRVITVSGLDGIHVDGDKVMETPDGVFAANLAVALGVCKALGVPIDDVVQRVPGLPTTEHRQSVSVAAGGYTIIDDTFNSNPDGAASAVRSLVRKGSGGRTALITPGMVELGPVQDVENRRLAEEAAARVDHLVIVGRTNRRALRQGSANGKAAVTVLDTRAQAVEWARKNLGPGDAVLYENDLPDHYP